MYNTGNIHIGYHGIFLCQKENDKSNILIFKDEKENLHLVIIDDAATEKDIHDPKVNGLKINLKQYKFQDVGIKQFIDLECSMKVYINQFTEVAKEIAEKILIKNELPHKSVRTVINNWKSFWSANVKHILSEEEQIGLICELFILKKLCEISPDMALMSWKGPLKEKHDFFFPNWVFEVKGTMKKEHIHIINGLEQLEPPSGKNLSLISFLLTKTDNINAKSLQDLIEEIEIKYLCDDAMLIEQFHNLLLYTGYTYTCREEYKKAKYELYSKKFYIVDEKFPKLTYDHLKIPLDSRISKISYCINLSGLAGDPLEKVKLEKYFY
jgi:hypothetical protein